MRPKEKLQKKQMMRKTKIMPAKRLMK